MRRVGLIVAVSVSLTFGFMSAPTASAQAPQTFGITTEIAHVVPATEFVPISSTDPWQVNRVFDPATGSVLRTSATAQVFWIAGLRLPAGAVVTRLELAGCDDSATTSLTFLLLRSSIPPRTGFTTVSPTGTSGPPSEVPGCERFSVTPSNPLIIDNANATYWISVSTEGGGFDSARVYYRLQVSPAPATATFGDVPTSHPFFQFVEALVASGITAGCGGGNYCPDAPLTRGQMAVFLSKALGLQFAP